MCAATSTPIQSSRFCSLLKWDVIGTHHIVSKEYLPLYLNEFSFRVNNRKNPEIFDEILRGC
jgi:transposase-like protein